MKNGVFIAILLIIINGCQSNGVSVSEYETLKRRAHALEDSLDELSRYYHFSKIKPIVYPLSNSDDATLDGHQVFRAVLAADGMRLNGSLVYLKVEASNEDITVKKNKGMHEIMYETDSIKKDTIFFNFLDPNHNKSLILPVAIP